MLKEKASLLQKHDEYLFGKKLRNNIVGTIKSKKQTKEIFIKQIKLSSISSSHSPRKCEGQKFHLTKTGSKKFHNGNQQQQQQQCHSYYGQTGSQQRRYGRYNCSTENLLQHEFEWRKTNLVGVKKGSPIDKNIILVEKYSRRSISRKMETFYRSLDENNAESEKFGHSKRIQNSISFQIFSVKNPLGTNSESRRGRIGQREPSEKFNYIPHCHFKMESLQNVKYMFEKGDTINSVTLELSKIRKVVSECQNLLNNPQASVLKLTKVISLLISSIQAVLPARMNCHFLQMQQISSLTLRDLFASKLIDHIKTYFSWRPDPLSQETDAFQQNSFHISLYAFLPFCMTRKILSIVLQEKVPMMILVSPAWPSQLWYSEAMRISIQQQILLIWRRDLLKNPKREIHPIVQNKP